jgi:hypothetical protein
MEQEGVTLQQLFVIDVTRGYLPAALLTAAAYACDGGEAMLVQGSLEHATVRKAVDRFRPARLLTMESCAPEITLGGGGDDALSLEVLPAESAPLLAWLMNNAVEAARGVVLFPAHSPSWAIKAAALAARLGYLAWPLEEASGFAYAAPANIPVLVLGEAPGALTDKLQGREYRHMAGDRAMAQFLKESGKPVGYVVLVNSADLEPPSYTGPGMGTAWTRGLSLLAALLTSYRDAWVVDARSPRPDSREIERTLNQKVHDADLAPEYLAILASPGAIPFIHEPNMHFGAGEDETRDIHLRLNDDLFFDCAEGRLFGQTAGKVSLQILSTKHFARLQGNFRSRSLIMGRPHVENNVTFALDEAVGRAQLKPLLEKAGLGVTELYDQDCSPRKIAEHLPRAVLSIYGGHGATESLATHEAPLYAEFLPPEIAPGVVYACACSTMYPKPNRVTTDSGFSCEEEPTPFVEQIGPAFVDRGALAFVGGLTVEDILLNTPMYVAFMQALVLKGMSVGQAVRFARNHTLTHMAVLSQRAPKAYAAYRETVANAVQQQVVLGDPAFRPFAGTAAAQLPVTAALAGDEAATVTLTLPADRWTRTAVTVDGGKRNKEFHRARSLEFQTPVGEDVYTWGENYTVALGTDDLSEKGVMGSYVRLSFDLPAGRVPTALSLAAAEAAPQECLLCGETHPVADAKAAFSKYVIPFLGKEAPAAHDQTKGWAFATEMLAGGGLRMHWLVPALVIADASRQAIRLQSATFRVDHMPGVLVEGKLELERSSGGSPGAPGAMEGTRGLLPDELLLTFGAVETGDDKEKKLTAAVAQTLAGPGGHWSCWLPAGALLGLKVAIPMPVYRHVPEAALSFTPEVLTGITAGPGPVTATLKTPATGTVRGTVLDAFTGRPLAGARVRLWRGKNGERPVFEGYVGEARADAQGRFEFEVPPGSYLAAAAHRNDLRYFSARSKVTVYKKREAAVLLALEPGALLTGRVEFAGAYRPKHGGIQLLEHGNQEEVVGRGVIRRDGSYAVLAPVTKPFDIQIWPEGFAKLVDDHGGEGYHLSPGEVLEQNFTVKG